MHVKVKRSNRRVTQWSLTDDAGTRHASLGSDSDASQKSSQMHRWSIVQSFAGPRTNLQQYFRSGRAILSDFSFKANLRRLLQSGKLSMGDRMSSMISATINLSWYRTSGLGQLNCGCREFLERTFSPCFGDPSDRLEVRPALTFSCHKPLIMVPHKRGVELVEFVSRRR